MHSAYCCSHSAYNVSFDTSIIRSRVYRFQIKPIFSIFFLVWTQSPLKVVKKPGETLTLSCRGSGFSFGCCSMHWIRQQAGKPLVWMGRVNSDSSDNSKSMVYLKLSGLTAEDSAVYYCARDSQ
uniref:Immunoglobulin heavy variable 4-8 n=1 Tax=Sinocyclocheilus rhinocerous TaxID=307959 RepID=A0A673HB67_9TELE